MVFAYYFRVVFVLRSYYFHFISMLCLDLNINRRKFNKIKENETKTTKIKENTRTPIEIKEYTIKPNEIKEHILNSCYVCVVFVVCSYYFHIMFIVFSYVHTNQKNQKSKNMKENIKGKFIKSKKR